MFGSRRPGVIAGSFGSRIRRLTGAVAAILLTALQARGGDHLERVQLLCTTDIHGVLDEAVEKGSAERQGWLRLATLIRERRASFGDDRTLLLDCGDTGQGTLAAALSRGGLAPTLLRTLEYDVWVPGNHEFDYGVRRLSELCNAVPKKVLCGNAELIVDRRRHRYPAWRMFSLGDNADVAVIGATASYLSNWLWGDHMRSFRVIGLEELISDVLPAILRRQPEMIVLATHQGWLHNDTRSVNEIARIADRFPEIDLILGGHTHREFGGMQLRSGTWYVQAGAHGRHLALIRADVDTEHHRVVNLASILEPVGMHTDVDPRAQAAVDKLRRETAAFAQRTIGSFAAGISSYGTPGETCRTSEFLCTVIAAQTDADVVIHGRHSRFSIRAGNFREQDLFHLIPYENRIGVASLTAAQIRAIIEEQWQKRESYVYCGLWGLQADIDRNGSVRKLRLPDGAAVSDDRRFRTAFNSYTAAGGGGRFPDMRRLIRLPASNLRDTGLNTREAVRRFLQNRPDFRLRMRRWIHTP